MSWPGSRWRPSGARYAFALEDASCYCVWTPCLQGNQRKQELEYEQRRQDRCKWAALRVRKRREHMLNPLGSVFQHSRRGTEIVACRDDGEKQHDHTGKHDQCFQIWKLCDPGGRTPPLLEGE